GGPAPAAPALTESIAPRLLLFCWVLDVLDLVKLDISGRAVEFLDPADVHVLNDIARVRIDRNRSARALPLHALGSLISASPSVLPSPAGHWYHSAHRRR